MARWWSTAQTRAQTCWVSCWTPMRANAACHIAFGDSYPGTTVGGTGLSKEELAARGMNHSSLHEDVMIGAEDSRITGKCRDGRTVPLFENGVWVL